MKRVQKIACMIAAVLLMAGLTACGGGEASNASHAENTSVSTETKSTEASKAETSSETKKAENESVSEETQSQENIADGKTLVVVFSATGTTKGVAEKIAKITDADFYEIVPAVAYTTEDLNWNDKNSRTTIEQNDESARPEIGSDALSLEGYDVIFIGYPIWWAIEPRIMDTFVESYNFDGITMIPFCTSGSSGIGKSGKNLAEHAGSGNWLDGKRFGGNVSEADLKKWIDGLKK